MCTIDYFEEAYYKALKIIDSCETEEHFKSAETYIENYLKLMQFKANKCFSFSKTITLLYEIEIRKMLLHKRLENKRHNRWELIDTIYSMATF